VTEEYPEIVVEQLEAEDLAMNLHMHDAECAQHETVELSVNVDKQPGTEETRTVTADNHSRAGCSPPRQLGLKKFRKLLAAFIDKISAGSDDPDAEGDQKARWYSELARLGALAAPFDRKHEFSQSLLRARECLEQPSAEEFHAFGTAHAAKYPRCEDWALATQSTEECTRTKPKPVAARAHEGKQQLASRVTVQGAQSWTSYLTIADDIQLAVVSRAAHRVAYTHLLHRAV
jgi:hypothetical protein